MITEYMTEKCLKLLERFCDRLDVSLQHATNEFSLLFGSEYVLFNPEEIDLYINVTIFWFCVDYHKGMRDPLYSMITECDYEPPVKILSINMENEISLALYDWFEEKTQL